MASDHNSSAVVEELAAWYGEDVESVEQQYPGIFRAENERENVQGEVDLLVTEGGIPEQLRAYEVKEVDSLSQMSILRSAFDAREQCDRIEEYLESRGYEAETDYIISPEGHLRAVYEIWQNLPEMFDMEDAKDAISEPGRISYIREEAMEEVDEDLYKIDDSLTSLMETEIVQL